MPNWCDNRVFLSHKDTTKLDALEQELMKWNNGKGDCQVFQSLRPRPATEEENWYDWNCNNWGTKWDASVIDWERNENQIAIYFESAWAPPVALYEFIAEEGWDVDAIYHEPGMGFAGTFIDGVEDYHEYDIADDDVLEILPEEIVEFAGLEYERERYLEEQEEENSKEV